MARIYLDARNITREPAGVARYAISLIPRLLAQAPEHQFVVLRHGSNQAPLFAEQIATGRLREHYEDCPIDNLHNVLQGHMALARAFRRHGPPDLFHNLFHISPMAAALAGPPGMKRVVTLHDLVWIDHPEASQPTWLKARAIELLGRLAIPRALAQADHVISVSAPTEARARPWLRPGRHSVIHHGVEPVFFEPPAPPGHPALRELLASGTPYIAAIGNAKPYKNLALLIEALGQLCQRGTRAHLVLIGACQPLQALVEARGLAQCVTFAGILDDAELRAALGHAHVFAFPSLVEGFGLPILEAMAMGIPTIVANLEPMRSIAGPPAIRFPPHSPAELAHAISDLLDDPTRHAQLAQTSRARARTFDWDETARQTLDVYRQCLQQG